MRLETPASVSPEEIEERISESRLFAFANKAPAQVVYQKPFALCPWPGCDYRIDGIQFRLETWCSPEQLAGFQKAWWLGPGLVGVCPHCKQFVLFELTQKGSAQEEMIHPESRLPPDWFEKAYLVSRTNPPTNGVAAK